MNTFILGVGAQKSGTTWLSKIFQTHPRMDMGFTKEYHILDSLFIENNSIEHTEWLIKRSKKIKEEHSIYLKEFISDIDKYFNYFQRLLESSEYINLTGDLTPSYAGLSEEAFKFVKDEFNKRGIKVKVIFIMRDPVERCISAVRHQLDREGLKKSLENEEYHLLNSYKKRGCLYRTQYEKTIINLEKAFEDDQIFLGFYEMLFSESEMLRLGKFLNIDISNAPFNKIVNKHRSDHQISLNLKKEIANYYKLTYEFIISRYGTELINSLWKNSNIVDY